MNKIPILLYFIFGSAFYSDCQVKVSTKKTGGMIGTVSEKSGPYYKSRIIASLSYSISESDTLYNLFMSDESYELDFNPATVSISFFDAGGSIDSLYTAVMSVFSKKNKKNKDYELSVVIGNKTLTIKKSNSSSFIRAVIEHERGYITLSEDQVKKLFGKTKK